MSKWTMVLKMAFGPLAGYQLTEACLLKILPPSRGKRYQHRLYSFLRNQWHKLPSIELIYKLHEGSNELHLIQNMNCSPKGHLHH